MAKKEKDILAVKATPGPIDESDPVPAAALINAYDDGKPELAPVRAVVRTLMYGILTLENEMKHNSNARRNQTRHDDKIWEDALKRADRVLESL